MISRRIVSTFRILEFELIWIGISSSVRFSTIVEILACAGRHLFGKCKSSILSALWQGAAFEGGHG
jgi:hypothetical protein